MVERWRGYTDDPIDEEDHDLLDRVRFARRVAAVLDDVRAGSESAVMALVGPWGSGKTSLLRLVGGAMPEPWRVVGFNPWATADVPSLVGEFFETIGSALPNRQGVRGAGEALLRYAQKVSPLLGAIPVAGQALAEIADRELGENTIEARAEEVADRLREVGAPILVVIDDVDRLHPDELTEVFRAVRLLGRLPMLYYLLSYDERTVLDLLGQTAVTGGDEARARAYLEKIVQYPLDLPPILSLHLDRMFDDGLARLLDHLGLGLTAEQHERIRTAWDTVMSRALDQPRAVQRYLARLATYLPLADPEEIDVADFALLTFLQQHAPETYELLAAGQERFTCRLTPGAGDQEEGEVTLPVTDLGTLEEEQVPNGQHDLLREIFALPDQRPSAVRRAYRERRAVVWDYFPRYFVFGVPETDLSDREVRDGLRAICRGEGTEERAAVEAAIGGPQQARIHLLSEDLGGEDAYRLLCHLRRHHLRRHHLPVGPADDSESLPVRRWIRDLLVRCRGGPSAAVTIGEFLGHDPDATRLLDLCWCLEQTREGADAAWLAELRDHLARRLLGPDGTDALRRLVDVRDRTPRVDDVFVRLSRRLDGAEAFELLCRAVEWPHLPVELAAGLLGQAHEAVPADEIVRRVVADEPPRRVGRLHQLVAALPGHPETRARLWGALGRFLVRNFWRMPCDARGRSPLAEVLSRALAFEHPRSLRAEEVVEAIEEGRFGLLHLAAHFVGDRGDDMMSPGRLVTTLYGPPGPHNDRLWQVVRQEARMQRYADPEPPGDDGTAAGRQALAFRAIMALDGMRARWEAEGFGPAPAADPAAGPPVT